MSFFLLLSITLTHSSSKKEQQLWNDALVIVAAIIVVSGARALWFPPICPVLMLPRWPRHRRCQCVLSARCTSGFLCLIRWLSTSLLSTPPSLYTVSAAVPSSRNWSPHSSQHPWVCFRGGQVSAGTGETFAVWNQVFCNCSISFHDLLRGIFVLENSLLFYMMANS